MCISQSENQKQMRFKLLILFYYFKFKWQRKRLFSKEGLGKSRQKLIKRWRQNLLQSLYYQPFKNQPLANFPIITKTEFMDNFDHINTVKITQKSALDIALQAEKTRNFSSMINGITIGLSSGTTGNKGIFLANEKERAMWVAAILDRVIGLELRKRKVAFFLRANSNLYESVGSSLLQFRFFDIKAEMSKNADDLIQFQPHIMVAQPSVLREIAAEYVQRKITNLPEKVISVAEVLEPEDKRFFEQVFQQKIHQVYQCTEGFLAATCEQGNLHFNEDFLIIEKHYLDVNKKRFHPIITDLKRFSQPIIRYELNDIIHEGEPCKCGRKSMTIDKIEGRSDDVFRFKKDDSTITIFPDFIRRAVIMASDEITFYTVIQRSDSAIDCYLEMTEKADKKAIQNKVKATFEDLFNSFKLASPTICFLDSYEIEKGQKLRRVLVHPSSSLVGKLI
jgi:putative adenylate-forming enzyme